MAKLFKVPVCQSYLSNMNADQLKVMKVALRWERGMKTLMEEKLLDDRAALQEKEGELSMLMENKERILAEQEKKEKLLDGFLLFIEAIENKDAEKVLKFDEKAMMKDVITLLNGYADDVGNASGIPGGNNRHEIALNADKPNTIANDAEAGKADADGGSDSDLN